MYERVLVGTDGSVTATRAVEAAAVLARAHGAELTVAYAFPPRTTTEQEIAWRDAPEEHRWRLSVGALAEAIVRTAIERAQLAGAGGLTVHGRFEPGYPVAVLLAIIDELDADALVIGNRDIGGWIRPRSIARALSRRATCDVVIVDTIGRREKRRAHSYRRALRSA